MLTFAILLMAAAQAQAPTLPAVQVTASEALSGRWQPDLDADAILSAAQSPDAAGGRGAPHPHGGGNHAGPPPGAGGPGGHGGGGHGGRGGHRGAGAPPPEGLAPAHAAFDLAGTELVVPVASDLLIAVQQQQLIVSDGPQLMQLAIGGEAITMANGATRAKAYQDSDDMVVELSAPDGRVERHAYHLEGDGARLRVLSEVTGPDIVKPIQSQHLYRREGDGG